MRVWPCIDTFSCAADVESQLPQYRHGSPSFGFGSTEVKLTSQILLRRLSDLRVLLDDQPDEDNLIIFKIRHASGMRLTSRDIHTSAAR